MSTPTSATLASAARNALWPGVRTVLRRAARPDVQAAARSSASGAVLVYVSRGGLDDVKHAIKVGGIKGELSDAGTWVRIVSIDASKMTPAIGATLGTWTIVALPSRGKVTLRSGHLQQVVGLGALRKLARHELEPLREADGGWARGQKTRAQLGTWTIVALPSRGKVTLRSGHLQQVVGLGALRKLARHELEPLREADGGWARGQKTRAHFVVGGRGVRSQAICGAMTAAGGTAQSKRCAKCLAALA